MPYRGNSSLTQSPFTGFGSYNQIFIILAVIIGLFLGIAIAANLKFGIGLLLGIGGLVLVCLKPATGVYAFFLLAPWELTTIFPGMTPATAVGYLAFIGFAYNVIITRKVQLHRTGQEWPFVLFVGFIVISSVHVFSVQFYWKGVVTIIQLMLLYYMIIHLIDTEKKLVVLLWSIFLAILITSLVGQYQYWHSSMVMRTMGAGRNPNYTAAAMVMGIFLGLALFVKQKYLFSKIFIALAEVSILMSFLFTRSRGGLVAFVIGIIYWLVKEKNKGKAVIIFLVVASIIFLIMPAGFKSRIAGQGEASHSTAGRKKQLNTAVLMITQHPLTGVGYNNYVYNYARYMTPVQGGEHRGAHNTYFKLAAEIGLLGLFAYILIIGNSWRSLNKARQLAAKDSWISFVCRMASCSLMSYIVSSFFADVETIKGIWALFAMGVMLIRIIDGEKHKLETFDYQTRIQNNTHEC